LYGWYKPGFTFLLFPPPRLVNPSAIPRFSGVSPCYALF